MHPPRQFYEPEGARVCHVVSGTKQEKKQDDLPLDVKFKETIVLQCDRDLLSGFVIQRI